MAADSDAGGAQQPNGTLTDTRSVADAPTTPQDDDILALSSSQVTLPSTEVPASPIEPNQSFKTEANDDRLSSSAVIPSSLTPPPSSQLVTHAANGALQTAYGASHRSALFSPPATGLNTTARRDGGLGTEYVPPAPQQVLEATADELRAMMQASIAEHAKLKMEAAHHKLQYNLLSLQADEDAKRAAVEQEMTRREIEALRTVEYSRHAVRELSAASESAQMKYLQMKMWYGDAMEENDALARRVKMAKKVIAQKEEEIIGLVEERDMLLNRIRENREHFHMLCSPGGIFHGAMTPKQQTISTPQPPHRATPKQTPRSVNRDEARVDGDHGPEPIAALLQALSQDSNNNNHNNTSAPSTPTTAVRPPATTRMPAKHTRNAQSLSSLPTTPVTRAQRHHEQQSGLLPSVNLVPQSEPRHRYTSAQTAPGTPPPPATQDRVQERARKSRESTISADDNEELARQALESVAKSASFLSQASRASRNGRRPLPSGCGNGSDGEEVYESQASQAASEMLRRDPRESFEVASSVGSRDGTPAPAEKSARLQAKLFSGITKSGTDKRKFGHGRGAEQEAQEAREARSDLVSPAKKMRVGGLIGENPKVGLWIQQGHN